MLVETVNIFGIGVHRVTMEETLALLLEWMREERPCRYVVTPNVDHVVNLQTQPEMRDAYEEAALILADGWAARGCIAMVGASVAGKGGWLRSGAIAAGRGQRASWPPGHFVGRGGGSGK